MAIQDTQSKYSKKLNFPVGTVLSPSSLITDGYVINYENKVTNQQIKLLAQRPNLVYVGGTGSFVGGAEGSVMCYDIQKRTSSTASPKTLIVTTDTGPLWRIYIYSWNTFLGNTGSLTYVGSFSPGGNPTLRVLEYPFDNQYIYIDDSNGNLLKINLLTNTFATVAFTSFNPSTPPNSMLSMAELDGYAFYLTADNRIYNSTPGTYETVANTDYIVPEQYGDTSYVLGRMKNYLACVSSNSIEFFYTSDEISGSPLKPAKEYTILLPDAVVRSSVVFAEDRIYFCTNSGTYVVDGFKLVKISTEVSWALYTTYTFTGGGYAQYFKNANKNFYLLPFANGFTLVYDIEEKLWYIWKPSDISWTSGGGAGAVPIAVSASGKCVTTYLTRKLAYFNFAAGSSSNDSTSSGNYYTECDFSNLNLGKSNIKNISQLLVSFDTNDSPFTSSSDTAVSFQLQDGKNTSRNVYTSYRSLTYNSRWDYWVYRKLGSWINPKLTIRFTSPSSKIFLKTIEMEVVEEGD